jgi:voltage-gated potassium channel
MDEDIIRKQLGIKKEKPLANRVWFSLRKVISLKVIIIVLIITILISAYFLFAYNEYIKHPELLEELSVEETSPYFMAFFWLVGTLIAEYAEAPYTNVGRLLDLLVIMIGALTTATIISTITSWIVSSKISNMFGIAGIKKKIDCIICGWNPISESAFKQIKRQNSIIVVIDKANTPEPAYAKEIHFISGDPTNRDILKKANIQNAKNIVLAMEEDADVLLAIHIIRDLNPWINIVAKINSHEHVKVAEAAGADQVVSPPSIGGRLLSMVTDEPSAVEWIVRTTSGDTGFKLIEYDVISESPIANKTIREARQHLKTQAKIIGVDTAEGFEKVPDDGLRIEPGNKLIMIIDTKRFAL